MSSCFLHYMWVSGQVHAGSPPAPGQGWGPSSEAWNLKARHLVPRVLPAAGSHDGVWGRPVGGAVGLRHVLYLRELSCLEADRSQTQRLQGRAGWQS